MKIQPVSSIYGRAAAKPAFNVGVAAKKVGVYVKNNIKDTIEHVKHPTLIIKDIRNLFKNEALPFAIYMIAIEGFQNLVIPLISALDSSGTLLPLMAVPEELLTVPAYGLVRKLLHKILPGLFQPFARCHSYAKRVNAISSGLGGMKWDIGSSVYRRPVNLYGELLDGAHLDSKRTMKQGPILY